MKKKAYLCVLLAACMTVPGASLLQASAAQETPFTEFAMSMETEPDSTVQEYNDTVDSFAEINADLEILLSEAEDLVNAGEDPYDESTLEDLNDAIAAAWEAEEELPEYLDETEPEEAPASSSVLDMAVPESEEQESVTLPELPDYTKVMDDLADAMAAYESSVQLNLQITEPDESFVSERLQQVESITDVAIAAEDNDPEGKLNQEDGYIGAVYFSDSLVDRAAAFISEEEDSVLSMGIKGGGSVEICSSPEDAAARDLYLAASDGTVFSAGSHSVLGSMVIRTSASLTTMEQEDLTGQIREALLAP